MKRLNRWMQLGAATLWVLAGGSAVLGWCNKVTGTFGLLAAIFSFAAFLTGNRVQAAQEAQIKALEKEQAGRTLSPAQLQALAEHLRSVTKPLKGIHLMGLQGNVESIRLAMALKGALEGAGFAVDGVWEDVLLGGTGPGILIRQEKQDDVGTGIKTALNRVGLEAKVIEMGRPTTEGKVEVVVGYNA